MNPNQPPVNGSSEKSHEGLPPDHPSPPAYRIPLPTDLYLLTSCAGIGFGLSILYSLYFLHSWGGVSPEDLLDWQQYPEWYPFFFRVNQISGAMIGTLTGLGLGKFVERSMQKATSVGQGETSFKKSSG